MLPDTVLQVLRSSSHFHFFFILSYFTIQILNLKKSWVVDTKDFCLYNCHNMRKDEMHTNKLNKLTEFEEAVKNIILKKLSILNAFLYPSLIYTACNLNYPPVSPLCLCTCLPMAL